MPPQRTRKFLVFALLALALLVAFAVAVWGRAGEPRYFAIRNARIVPVSGPPIDGGTVVMANGLITAVGKDVPVPAEAWVIDGKGLTVYPGLIDALTDLGLQAAAPAARAGGAAAAQAAPATPAQAPAAQQQRPAHGPEDRPATSPWLNAADDLKTDDRRLESWRNVGFTTALTASRSGIFPGQGAVINLAGDRPGDLVVKAPATLTVTFSTLGGGGGGGGGGFPSALMGTLAYIKQVLLDTAQYAAAQQLYDANARGLERPAYDRTVRVINAALRSGRPVFLPGNTPAQINRALALAAEFKLNAVIYGGQQAYDPAPALLAAKLPVLVSLRWPEKERDADPEAPESLRTLHFRDRAPSAPAALEKAGVKFGFYSDGITAPRDIFRNVRKAIEAGLTPDGALRAFTLSAAEILGVADRLGSIEAGKIANLVVADGDLFNEKTKLKMIFIDGRKFEVRETPEPPRRAAEAEGAQ